MVTSSTDGWCGQRASSSRRTRDVVLLPTATLPATPMTNGTRTPSSPRKREVATRRSKDAVTMRLSSRDSGR